MDKKEYRIRGHETFILRDGWVTKGLQAVAQNPRVFTDKSGTDALGVGTNMAKAIQYWLRTANLILPRGVGAFDLTPTAQIISENDPYLEDPFSAWILHINIAQNFKLATSWNVFFNYIDISTFKRDELVSLMRDQLVTITGDEKLPERTIRDDCAAIIQMYEDGKDESVDPEDKMRSPFASLGLLRAIDDNRYEKSQPAIDQLDPLAFLYTFSDALTVEKAIHIDDIARRKDMPGRILNLNRIAVNDYLDYLHNKDLITVNRTAGLDMVYEKAILSRMDILDIHYRGKSI